MRWPIFWPWFFWAVGGFLLGGMMFSQWLPKLLVKKDVAGTSEDHNPGAVNVFLICGPWMGMLCLMLDLLKGFAPVYLAKTSLDMASPFFAGVIAAPVLGHAAGVFHKFRGGKCIATAFGVLAALAPETWIVLLLAALYIFFSTLVKVAPMTRRSILVFSLFGVLAFGYLHYVGRFSLALGCAVVAAVVIYRHWRSAPGKEPAAETYQPAGD